MGAADAGCHHAGPPAHCVGGHVGRTDEVTLSVGEQRAIQRGLLLSRATPPRPFVIEIAGILERLAPAPQAWRERLEELRTAACLADSSPPAASACEKPRPTWQTWADARLDKAKAGTVPFLSKASANALGRSTICQSPATRASRMQTHPGHAIIRPRRLDARAGHMIRLCPARSTAETEPRHGEVPTTISCSG